MKRLILGAAALLLALAAGCAAPAVETAAPAGAVRDALEQGALRGEELAREPLYAAQAALVAGTDGAELLLELCRDPAGGEITDFLSARLGDYVPTGETVKLCLQGVALFCQREGELCPCAPEDIAPGDMVLLVTLISTGEPVEIIAAS